MSVWVQALEFEVELGSGQKRGHLPGLMQEMGAERWNGREVEGVSWSVRVSALLPDAGCNCASGLHSDFALKGWDGAERSDEAAYSLTASCGSSGSFC